MMANENRERDSARREFLKHAAAATLAMGAAGSSRAYAQEEPSSIDMSEVTSFVEGQIEDGHVPGALLMASLKGKVFFEQYWGTCCDGTRRDVSFDGDTLHFLASFSKVVSATVVAMVQEEGLLDYDEPVSTYIPEFTGGGKDTITLRHLLTHSAGIPSVSFGPPVTPEQWQACLDKVCAADTEWPPGSRTLYHALSAMFVAAEAVRRVSGMQPWPTICRERLFKPLGAQSMTFALPPEGTPVSLAPQRKELPCPLDADHYGLLGHPAGGCLSTPGDVLKVLQLHLDGGSCNGKQLLKAETVAEMQRVQYADAIAGAVKEGRSSKHEFWGLGWLTRGTTTTGWFGFGDQVSERAFGHAGLDTVIGIADPETGLAFTFITTDSPSSNPQTVLIRNTVTNLVAKAVV
jgi:CubicO group peptidase (beta-lactamase class C family)